ncbi:MAG: hypothetical protein ACI8UO_002049 [Verrucomicrobiales bacterium]|jgi:hypothetical protein
MSAREQGGRRKAQISPLIKKNPFKQFQQLLAGADAFEWRLASIPKLSIVRAMRILLATLATFSLILGPAALQAEEKTVTTTSTCAKCDLKTATACLDVIKIEGKWLELSGQAKSFHRKICRAAKQVVATGEVKGEKFVVSKIEVKE